jgi:predicted nuclease of restriction endonuclease-like (RecB) superfamily
MAHSPGPGGSLRGATEEDHLGIARGGSALYANEVFKSTCNLGFLGIMEPMKELELENRLIAKIRAFILELGRGFSFLGNQYRLEYNGKEYLFIPRRVDAHIFESDKKQWEKWHSEQSESEDFFQA